MVQNLTKVYGTQVAINSLNFSINKGEIVGFLGPNGAGKSTTMKIITGYLTATSGTVSVCGIAVQHNSIDTKKQIGYLPELNPLYTDMYVRQYLTFVAQTHLLKNVNNCVEDTLQKVGLTPEANKKIHQLSKGYKQRVGLAAAIIHNPAVLILDEPTTGLDPNQIQEIRNLIKELGKEKTVLFSSHILQEVEAICTRIIIINKGVLVADDSLINLQKNITENVIKVSFSNEMDINALQSIATVTRVQYKLNQGFYISCTNPDAVKKDIMQLVINNNNNITAMQTEVANLANIFAILTN